MAATRCGTVAHVHLKTARAYSGTSTQRKSTRRWNSSSDLIMSSSRASRARCMRWSTTRAPTVRCQLSMWTASDSAFYALEREFYPPRSRTAFDRFMAAHPARWRPIRAFYTAPPLGWQQDTLERERPLTVGQGGKKDDDPPRCVQWSNDTRPFAYQHIF